MKISVGDKVAYRPNWEMSGTYRIAQVIAQGSGSIALRVKYINGWTFVSAQKSEIYLLSPVEAVLYDWENDAHEV
jgi:hypothetical protein